MKFLKFLAAIVGMSVLTSCSTTAYELYAVRYQSVRTVFAQPEKIPEDAKIAVSYIINSDGDITPIVYNLSDDVLTLDLTQSFLIDAEGKSIMFYNNTIRTSTSGSYNSETSGSTFNLGGLAGALGIGGPFGSLMSATTLGSSNTYGNFSSNTVTIAETPTTAIGPGGRKGLKTLNTLINPKTFSNTYVDKTSKDAIKFRICLTYNFEGQYKDTFVTDFYVNSQINEPISNGRTADAFRSVYARKPDALVENFFNIKVSNNVNPFELSEYSQGVLVDYK